MVKLQAFRVAARSVGFVEENESAGGTVLWLRKNTPDTAREMHQKMCIDSLTNSVTVYWMVSPGKVNSKTFRGVPALQQWLDIAQKAALQKCLFTRIRRQAAAVEGLGEIAHCGVTGA